MFAQPAYAWADPVWRAAAEAWIGQVLAARGGELTGPTRGVRFTPWSAVLRAPTSEGNVYFKACGPSQAHEPALAALLYEARPDCMARVLAADRERGWLLAADGGPTLTEAIRATGDEIDHWSRVLALIAGVQREMTPRAAELLAGAVPDRRPAILPDQFAAILARPDRLLVGEPGALTTAGLGRLRARAPRVQDICVELAAAGPPDTFVHDDFHEDHIFAREQGGAWRYAFFDFGDACITHPFVQLVSQPRFAANRFEVDDDPIKKSLREFYLSHWLDFAPPKALARALSLALVAGCIVRALTWVNACGAHLDELPAGLREVYGSRLAFWLLQIGRRIELLRE